jgi:hypothetical protein
LGRRFPDTEVGELSLWLRYPQAETVTLRVVDSSGQCHQIVLRITTTDEWQQVRFPLAEFFRRMGTPEAVEGVAWYEKSGGAGVGMDRSLRDLTVDVVRSIRLRMKSDDVEQYGVRFVDATGQVPPAQGSAAHARRTVA